ncbi:MAG: hypothetical protein ACIAQU_11580 [Phycisphaerales bacterium JB064]
MILRSRAARAAQRNGTGMPRAVAWLLLKWVGLAAYWTIEILVLVLAVPVMIALYPLFLLSEQLKIRKRIYEGLEVTHWPARDAREDYKVADTSRLEEGLVGVHTRSFGCLYNIEIPAFSDQIEFITIKQFWLGPQDLLINSR